MAPFLEADFSSPSTKTFVIPRVSYGTIFKIVIMEFLSGILVDFLDESCLRKCSATTYSKQMISKFISIVVHVRAW